MDERSPRLRELVGEHASCACYVCDPERFPRFATRQGEFHAAIYLGDDPGAYEVLIDGEVSRRALEAFAGRGNGKAVVVREPAHRCFHPQADSGICLTEIYGDVSLRTKVSEGR